MIIDLRNYPVFYATIEKNTERHVKMDKMFNRLEYSNTKQINGPIANPYTIGIADTHIQALQNEGSIIVLEDDAQETSDYYHQIDIPDDLDALYLGTSHFGMLRGQSTPRGAVTSHFSETLIRPYNMLAIHAVLYLSQAYKDRVIKLLTKFKENPVGGCDEPIAMDMKNHKILAMRNPMFYQNDGHSEQTTTTILVPHF